MKSTNVTAKANIVRNLGSGLAFAGLALFLIVSTIGAQTDADKLRATSANVSPAGDAVRINIVRWSTDEERNALVLALKSPATVAPSGGRGGAPPRAATDEFADFQARSVLTNSCTSCHTLERVDAASYTGEKWRTIVAAMRERGAVLTTEDVGTLLEYLNRTHAPSAPLDPVGSLAAAMGQAPTIGYFWTNGATGYAIKYAYRVSLPGGNERIILATDRRLGISDLSWKPVAPSTATNYPFTVIEVKLGPGGLGEGKTSLNTKVIVDAEGKTIALDNYAATPATLQNVKR